MTVPREPYGPRPSYPAPANSSSGEAPRPEDEDGDAMDCPECGRRLPNMHARHKESIIHWGDRPLPANHETLVARQKQADLLGRDRPEY